MVFVHLAFWDRRCLAMLDRIEAAGRDTEVDIDLVVNDLSLPIWAAVPPRDATRIAIESAEALDARIDGYPDDSPRPSSRCTRAGSGATTTATSTSARPRPRSGL